LKLIILDTDEIVKRYMAYDSLFSFYENGIKDLIQTAVLGTGKHKPSFYNERDTDLYWMRSLAGQVVREWEYGLDQALERGQEAYQDYQVKHYRVDRDLVQLVAEQIEEDIDRLMKHLTGEDQFVIRPADSVVDSWNELDFGFDSWIGNDLVVKMSQV
jgi:hypothetical protein